MNKKFLIIPACALFLFSCGGKANPTLYGKCLVYKGAYCDLNAIITGGDVSIREYLTNNFNNISWERSNITYLTSAGVPFTNFLSAKPASVDGIIAFFKSTCDEISQSKGLFDMKININPFESDNETKGNIKYRDIDNPVTFKNDIADKKGSKLTTNNDIALFDIPQCSYTFNIASKNNQDIDNIIISSNGEVRAEINDISFTIATIKEDGEEDYKSIAYTMRILPE